MELTDGEQELREMSPASAAAAAGDVCDTYCTTGRVPQRCDTGPTKYTITADDDPLHHPSSCAASTVDRKTFFVL